MNEERIENVKIESVSLTFISFFITVKGNGFGVTLGGYAIGHGFLGADPQDFEACGEGLVAMMNIMNVVGVDRWEDLVGKYARVKVGGLGSTVSCIGNIIKDEWFDIKKFFEAVKAKGGERNADID